MELKTQKAKVEGILRDKPETRSDDKALIYYYLQRYLSLSKPEQAVLIKILKSSPPMDSFKRIRADFNKKGLYLGSEEVQASRRNMGHQYNKMFTGGL